MLKKLVKNSLLFGIAPYVPKVVSVFLLPIMTQYLTATDYGIAGTIDAYTQGITAFSTLGFSSVLSISFYRCKFQYKILWREIYGFLQYWMVIFAIIQGILLYFIIPNEAAENKWWIILFTNFSNVFFGATAIIGNSYYVLNLNPLPVVTRSIIAGIVTVLANYILVVHYRLGYLGWYIGGFIGTFIVNASYWYTINLRLKLTPIFNYKRKTILKYLKISIPTIPHYYSMFLMNSSSKVVMDTYSCTLSSLGQINIVTQIGSLIENGINSINQAIAPMAMKELSNKNEVGTKKLIYLYSSITLFGTFLFSIWSKEIFNILISNVELASTYPYAILFIMTLNYRPMYVAVSNIFFLFENTASLLKITFIAGLIALGLYILLIPLFSMWGVVISYYIAGLYLGYSGFHFKFFKERTKVKYSYFNILIIQLTLTILAFLIVETNIVYKLITTAISIIFLYKVTKLFRK